MAVTVSNATVTRATLGDEAREALWELFQLRDLPLAQTRVSVDISGVPTAVVNGLRRAVCDEMPGRALVVGDPAAPDGTTDEFLLPEFVHQRVRLTPLRHGIPADVARDLVLGLDVTNHGAAPLSVYTGDFVVVAGAMPEPLFNPTIKLGVLQPGKRLVIEGVRIASGDGRNDAAYMVARRARFTHLDLEQWGDAETREEHGPAVDLSGYKTSCLVADPRSHRLTFELPAAADDPAGALSALGDACANIKERLRLVASTVRRAGEPWHRGAHYAEMALADGLAEGSLRVPGETSTLGEILRRAVFEREPGVANVSYVVVPHENALNFSLRLAGGDVTELLRGAIDAAIETFDAIQRGLAAL